MKGTTAKGANVFIPIALFAGITLRASIGMLFWRRHRFAGQKPLGILVKIIERFANEIRHTWEPSLLVGHYCGSSKEGLKRDPATFATSGSSRARLGSNRQAPRPLKGPHIS